MKKCRLHSDLYTDLVGRQNNIAPTGSADAIVKDGSGKHRKAMSLHFQFFGVGLRAWQGDVQCASACDAQIIGGTRQLVTVRGTAAEWAVSCGAYWLWIVAMPAVNVPSAVRRQS